MAVQQRLNGGLYAVCIRFGEGDHVPGRPSDQGAQSRQLIVSAREPLAWAPSRAGEDLCGRHRDAGAAVLRQASGHGVELTQLRASADVGGEDPVDASVAESLNRHAAALKASLEVGQWAIKVSVSASVVSSWSLR